MPTGVYPRTKKKLKSPGSFKPGHPFYGDLSAPHFWKKGQVAHNKGIPMSEKQKQDISLSRDTPERRAEIEVVRHLYWEEELSTDEISVRLGISSYRMLYLMRNYVHWRSCSEAMKLRIRNHPETIPKGADCHTWRGGIGKLPYSFEFDWRLKQSIKERDNYTCQECNITEAESILLNGIYLDVHHIDYDKQNCSRENLITLCKHCNGTANHNRDYWEGHFKEKMCQSVEKVLSLP